jgi:2-C-methyl-D-erythritol 4-phosphate cytidylyltransferase
VTGEVGCILVAAGSGTRLGADRPKAFVPLAGRTLLEHAMARVAGSGVLGPLVVVVPPALVVQAGELDGVRAARTLLGGNLVVVPGGSDRTGSVRRGLAALPPDVGSVLVHDAARCLVPPELVRRVSEALAFFAAVVPGLPPADTVKQVDAAGDVVATPDRSTLRLVQTPQGFDRTLLEHAHRAADAAGGGSAATDDAALVERLGQPVHVVPGDPRALKVTTPDDLAYAGWLLAADRAASSLPEVQAT